MYGTDINAMLSLIRNLFNAIFFPPFCPYCYTLIDDARAVFCSPCAARIQPVMSLLFRVSADKTISIFAVGSYTQPLESLITAKYHYASIASVQMGYLISRLPVLEHIEFDYIVPIPLHWSRRMWRGFNQADIIAQTVAQKYNKPVLHALKRTVRTKAQASLSLTDRATNVADAFALNVDYMIIENKTILLIDDLFTTGATVRSAAKVLMRGNNTRVHVAVLCRAV